MKFSSWHKVRQDEHETSVIYMDSFFSGILTEVFPVKIRFI